MKFCSTCNRIVTADSTCAREDCPLGDLVKLGEAPAEPLAAPEPEPVAPVDEPEATPPPPPAPKPAPRLEMPSLGVISMKPQKPAEPATPATKTPPPTPEPEPEPEPIAAAAPPAPSEPVAPSPPPIPDGPVSFCDQCGSRVEPGHAFCGECGHRLVTGAEAAAPGPVPEPQPLPEPEPPVVVDPAPVPEVPPVPEPEPEPEPESQPLSEQEPTPTPVAEPEAIPAMIETVPAEWDWEEPVRKRAKWPWLLLALAVIGGAGYYGWGRYYGPGTGIDPELIVGGKGAGAPAGSATGNPNAPTLAGRYTAHIADQQITFDFGAAQALAQAKGTADYANSVTGKSCASVLTPATKVPEGLPPGATAFDQSPREGFTACSAKIPISIEIEGKGIAVKWYKPGTTKVLMTGTLEAPAAGK